MAKRQRPLSAIDWELLEHDSVRAKRSKHGSGDDIEEEEDETVHIDQSHRQKEEEEQQQHGLAILNSMAIDKSSIVNDNGGGRKGAAIQEDVPTVPLDDHYNTLYNKIMTTRFPPRYVSESSEEEEEDITVDTLFGSLGSHAPPSVTEQQKKRKAKARRLVQTPAYNRTERDECFLCSWGNRHHGGIKHKHIDALETIYGQYGEGCDNIDLALHLSIYYEKNVYKPGRGMTMLTKEIALEHIEGLHSLSATIFLGEAIRSCKKVMFGFQNAIFKANGKYDKEAANQFKEMIKMICMLHKMKPSEMLFNYGKTREDTARMGRPFNMMAQMKQVRDKEKRAKRTKQINTANEVFNRGLEI